VRAFIDVLQRNPVWSILILPDLRQQLGCKRAGANLDCAHVRTVSSTRTAQESRYATQRNMTRRLCRRPAVYPLSPSFNSRKRKIWRVFKKYIICIFFHFFQKCASLYSRTSGRIRTNATRTQMTTRAHNCRNVPGPRSIQPERTTVVTCRVLGQSSQSTQLS
jgi:hypothetical protein